MKTLLAIASAAVVAVMASCSGSVDSGLTTIDIAANVGCADKGSLNDFFDVTAVVHPEFTDSSMIQYPGVMGTFGDRIYILDNNRLMTFSMADGRCLSSFDHTGNGPGEYIMLYFCYPSPDNGDWIAFDMRSNRILHYTPEGVHLASYPANIGNICPNGNGWAGPEDVPDGANQVVYLYNEKMELTDSIATTIPRHYLKSNLFEPYLGSASLVAGDTLYCVTDDRRFLPTMAFNLGQYAKPIYTEDEVDRMIEEMSKYINFNFEGVEGLASIAYKYDKKLTLQLYDTADGSLLYSEICDVSSGYSSAGFKLEVDGETVLVGPTGIATDDSLFFMSNPNEGDEDVNPTIYRLTVKK